ncbi:GH39 family glycosyl hydrolase [Limisphaera ngatamarikiensis]|uniref:GH39 family glycosyl hydrolase n=1 Tax=Limisphaera ngatamarikiensis TaxID=1324935 RepID=UPI00197E980A|nr:hypothetical protein [Limisphaera ngatamarikiensis]
MKTPRIPTLGTLTLLAWVSCIHPIPATGAPGPQPAPKPLYRDPVHDGAADPVVIWNPHRQRWWMFYTNRRANATNAPGVSWVHGTRIGIAESPDRGRTWLHLGTADIDLPPEFGEDQVTHWAPEVITDPDGLHHMFLTVVPGIFTDWNHPRDIVHLTSTNLRHWRFLQKLRLASDRVIDACILRLPDGTWRLWYNNERDRKSIYYADSPDLRSWTDRGKTVGDQPGEGPKVFFWQNHYWMITDVWRGLAVYKSTNALHWTRQPHDLLAEPGQGPDDGVVGQHPDVVVSGNRAFLFYFTHPGRRGPDAQKDGYEQRRSSIQVVELAYTNGWLHCDRDAPTFIELLPPAAPGAGPAPFPVHLHINAAQPGPPWPPVWRFFGCDEPNYAYMPNGQKLMRQLGALRPDQVFFRTHNLLNSGDGTPALKWGSTGVYREDEQGRPIYDWTILDRIFDTYRACRVRPYVEIGFMPRDLSTRPDPYQHNWHPGAPYEAIYTGWAHPPRDYGKWADLVYAWVQHCIERYGRAEVEQWYWQVWNEPNIGYWQGTRDEFLRLHDFAIHAVRRALPTARVGGPDVAGSGGRFMEAFLVHCLRGTNHATGRRGTPLDFVSFHAKGAPVFTNGHVRMGLHVHLRTIRDGFRLLNRFPELRDTPVILGESDPEGCAACQGPQLGYRNGTLYASYTAASFPRILELARRHQIRLEGVLTWAFTFENQPPFAGFRQLATDGIDLPVLNVFRMFSRMDGAELPVTSTAAAPLDDILEHGVRNEPDVAAVATLTTNALHVLLWHYHDDDLPGPSAHVHLTFRDLPEGWHQLRLTHLRIDHDHSNAYTEWLRMGQPNPITPEQRARLEAASALSEYEPARTLPVHQRQISIDFILPRQGVSFLTLSNDHS